MAVKRIFFIVLDSFGIGYAPDADKFGDFGSNTLKSIMTSNEFETPNMKKIGFFNIDGIDFAEGVLEPSGAFGRMQEASNGKDTTTGHWEIAGIVSPEPMPTYPDGFPDEVIDVFCRQTGRGYLCNKPYSGTEVINDYGQEHMETGKLIIYTSADSVFQIAAHEDIVPVETLYKYCEIARDILKGRHAVGRVIARPFTGSEGNFTRTANRHDFSLTPPKPTMLDALSEAGFDTLGVGKIYDIFAGKGVSYSVRTKDNDDGMKKTLELAGRDFNGICFVNLVDCDMIYGHRRDIDGYARSISAFDRWLGDFLNIIKEDDIVMISADHGCDPGFKGTDHTREYVLFLACGGMVKPGVNLGTHKTFSDMAATVLDIFGVKNITDGTSFKDCIIG